jgi:glutathione S-transferase
MTSRRKVQLYFHDLPSPVRALLCLEECDVPYEIVPIDLYRGQNHEPDFKKINPNGKVPALRAERHYRVLDSRLAQVPFLAGETYTIADMSAWSWVKLAALALDGGSLDSYPAVKKWFDIMSVRPAVIRTLTIAADVRSRSKTVLDEEARRHMFPQNEHLGTPA